MSPVLDVSSALRYPGQSYRFEAEIAPSQYDISGDTVAFSGVTFRGEYLSGGGTVSLKGTVEATARANCDRCLKEFEFPVRAGIDAKFAADDGGDPDIYPLDGHRITLDDPAKDALLLELASAPGGFDRSLADNIGLRAIAAPGLPGRCAPRRAAELMCEAIYASLEEGDA